MTLELDLATPAADETREQFLTRCLITLDDIGIILAIGAATGRLRTEIQSYLDAAQRFLEPDVPSEFTALLTEWKTLPNEPAV